MSMDKKIINLLDIDMNKMFLLLYPTLSIIHRLAKDFQFND
jgi:hypothetical protein